jgi:hypothetical protein
MILNKYFIFYREVDEFNNPIIGEIHYIIAAPNTEEAIKALQKSPSFLKRGDDHPQYINVIGDETHKTIKLFD